MYHLFTNISLHGYVRPKTINRLKVDISYSLTILTITSRLWLKYKCRQKLGQLDPFVNLTLHSHIWLTNKSRLNRGPSDSLVNVTLTSHVWLKYNIKLNLPINLKLLYLVWVTYSCIQNLSHFDSITKLTQPIYVWRTYKSGQTSGLLDLGLHVSLVNFNHTSRLRLTFISKKNLSRFDSSAHTDHIRLTYIGRPISYLFHLTIITNHINRKYSTYISRIRGGTTSLLTYLRKPKPDLLDPIINLNHLNTASSTRRGNNTSPTIILCLLYYHYSYVGYCRKHLVSNNQSVPTRLLHFCTNTINLLTSVTRHTPYIKIRNGTFHTTNTQPTQQTKLVAADSAPTPQNNKT
jgi:hypothetical protein